MSNNNFIRNRTAKGIRGKDHNSVSPNMRPLTGHNNINDNYANNNINNIHTNKYFPQTNININQLNQINIIDPHNYNIRVNKAKFLQKNPLNSGQIIEGDLNFDSKKSSQRTGNFNRSTKQKARIPRKSPVPVPKNFDPKKKIISHRISSGNTVTSKLLNGGMLRSGNFLVNFGKNINQNIIPKSSSTRSSDRSHSPLIRTNEAARNNLFQGQNKKRHVSKSPVLLNKNSILNRFKNFGFGFGGIINNYVKKNGGFGSQAFNGSNCGYSNNRGVIGSMNNRIGGNNVSNSLQFNNYNNIKKSNVAHMNQKNRNKKTVISGELMENKEAKKQDNNLHIISSLNNYSKMNDNPMLQKNNYVNNSNNNFNNNNNNNNNNININNNNNNINNNNINNSNNNNIRSVNYSNNKYNNTPNNESVENSEEIIDLRHQLKNNKSTNLLGIETNEINSSPLLQKSSTSTGSLLKQRKTIRKIRDIFTFTHVGFDGENNKENNQDSYFIYKNFAGHKDYLYMSVCDGHGVEGHFVSRFIKEILPVDMSDNLRNKDILNDTENVHQIIKETFLIANDKLVETEEINSLFSGSTCVSVIYTPEKLIVPNIGDSRAVMAREEANGLRPLELSRDHKPTEKDEALRILENEGRIQPFLEEGEFVGPERVWVKDDDVPGLAMTRSFGDRVAATVGVISEPEIKEFELNDKDKFLLIASDGVWEFISNQEVIDMISKYSKEGRISEACEALYEESKKRWLREEEVIDDITMILVVFE